MCRASFIGLHYRATCVYVCMCLFVYGCVCVCIGLHVALYCFMYRAACILAVYRAMR